MRIQNNDLASTEPQALLKSRWANDWQWRGTVKPRPMPNAAQATQGKLRSITPTLTPSASRPAALRQYARGPVGFLQWLAATHPLIFKHIKEKRPELLAQAGVLTESLEKQVPVPACPGARAAGLAGFGDWTDAVTSWIGQIGTVASSAMNTYSQYKQIVAKPPVQQQLQQVAVGQPPLAYGPAPARPPAPATVTAGAGGFGTTGLMIMGGAALLVGFLVLKK